MKCGLELTYNSKKETLEQERFRMNQKFRLNKSDVDCKIFVNKYYG